MKGNKEEGSRKGGRKEGKREWWGRKVCLSGGGAGHGPSFPSTVRGSQKLPILRDVKLSQTSQGEGGCLTKPLLLEMAGAAVIHALEVSVG